MNIAGRNYGIEGKVTTRNYVQDGLVAMWDGIESKMEGSVLKDMVSGLNFDFSQRDGFWFIPPQGNVTSYHAHQGSMNAAIVNAILQRNMTISCYFKIQGYGPDGYDVFRIHDIIVLRTNLNTNVRYVKIGNP